MRSTLSTLMLPFALQLLVTISGVFANPDAKRLYDDLLSSYNRLIRPVSNNTDTILVKLGLRLSQLIELVRLVCVDVNFHSLYKSKTTRNANRTEK